MLIYIPTILAVVAIVARYVRVLEPLHAWIPARWRWLPSAILAVVGHIAQQLPGSTDVPGMVEAFLGAAVIAALAAAAGLHAPETQAAPKPPNPLSKVGPAALLALLVAGCSTSLQVAKSQGLAARQLGASAASLDRCTRLSRQEHRLHVAAVASCALGGSAGIAILPVSDQEAQEILFLTSAGFAVSCLTLEEVRAAVAARWAKECQ